MKIETLNKAIMILTASFPGITFNAKLYDEMLGDLPDKCFLEAVYDFIKTTKELYPGSNPIAILREMTRNRIPELPKPKRTKEQIQQWLDMEETYKKLRAQAELKRIQEQK